MLNSLAPRSQDSNGFKALFRIIQSIGIYGTNIGLLQSGQSLIQFTYFEYFLQKLSRTFNLYSCALNSKKLRISYV